MDLCCRWLARNALILLNDPTQLPNPKDRHKESAGIKNTLQSKDVCAQHLTPCSLGKVAGHMYRAVLTAAKCICSHDCAKLWLAVNSVVVQVTSCILSSWSTLLPYASLSMNCPSHMLAYLDILELEMPARLPTSFIPCHCNRLLMHGD